MRCAEYRCDAWGSTKGSAHAVAGAIALVMFTLLHSTPSPQALPASFPTA